MLTERLENWQGKILQAATFSIGHIGYYPWNAWPLFVLVFPVGIALGWLKMKRRTLVAPGMAHGFLG
jgi:membrane protease YdiL (CAAX protease family)